MYKQKLSYKKVYSVMDELYTPKKLVNIIIPYIIDYEIRTRQDRNGNDLIIWCPFDTEYSEYVIELQKFDKIKVVYSSIADDKDFFKYEPEHWDIAVSNPPFSKKKAVFERLFMFKKPFAMVMNLMAINYQEIGNLFYKNPVQLLIPDKKISFNGNTSSFCSGYICKDILPDSLIFCHMEDNNSGSNFVPAALFAKLEREKNEKTEERIS